MKNTVYHHQVLSGEGGILLMISLCEHEPITRARADSLTPTRGSALVPCSLQGREEGTRAEPLVEVSEKAF